MKKQIVSALIYSLAGSAVVAQPVLPDSAPPAFEPVEGKTGNAYRPRSGTPLVYPLALMDAGAGAVAFAVLVEEETTGMANVPLLSSGAPPSTWFFLQIHEGKLVFVFQRGEKPFTGIGEFYFHTSIDVADWTPGVWHHVAVSWAAAGPGESAAVLFVDGAERESRFNLTLASGSPMESLTVGANSARLAPVETSVAIDDLNVWNIPLSESEIRQAMEGGVPQPGALVLHATFDEGFEAVSSVELSADFSDPSALVSRIRQ